MGGGGKASTVKYVGPSPQDLNQQYQQQQQALAQQQSLFQSQYQNQIDELSSAYNNSLSLLTQQMQERSDSQNTLLGQLNLQLTAAQQEATTNKGLYSQLLERQTAQSLLSDAESEKAANASAQMRQDNVMGASALLKLLGERRSSFQEASRTRGSTGAYSQAGVDTGSLLR